MLILCTGCLEISVYKKYEKVGQKSKFCPTVFVNCGENGYFSRMYTLMGVPWKSQLSRILFSR